MTELSPATQAIWSAYEAILEYECVVTKTDMKALASALRAAAYQVVPARPVLDSCCEHFEQAIRHKLLAISTELEAN